MSFNAISMSYGYECHCVKWLFDSIKLIIHYNIIMQYAISLIDRCYVFYCQRRLYYTTQVDDRQAQPKQYVSNSLITDSHKAKQCSHNTHR